MEAIQQKKELINWIEKLENSSLLESLYQFKKKTDESFEERVNKALTIEDFKTEMIKRIQEYPKRK